MWLFLWEEEAAKTLPWALCARPGRTVPPGNVAELGEQPAVHGLRGGWSRPALQPGDQDTSPCP